MNSNFTCTWFSGTTRCDIRAWVKASGGSKKLASTFGTATKEVTGEDI